MGRGRSGRSGSSGRTRRTGCSGPAGRRRSVRFALLRDRRDSKVPPRRPRPAGGGPESVTETGVTRHGARVQRPRGPRLLRRPGAVPRPRVDRRASRRPAHRGRGRRLPRRGGHAARPRPRRRAGPRPRGDGREGRGQHGDGGRASAALPGHRHRALGHAPRGVLPPRGEREHRRLRDIHRHQRRRAPPARHGRDVQRPRQQRPGERGGGTGGPALPHQPVRRAAGGHRTAPPSDIPASSASASPRTRRAPRGSRSRRSAGSRTAPRRSP